MLEFTSVLIFMTRPFAFCAEMKNPYACVAGEKQLMFSMNRVDWMTK